MRTRAVVLHEYGAPWSVENIELDPPRAGEVLVQLAAPNGVVSALGLPAMSPTIGARGLRHRHRGR